MNLFIRKTSYTETSNSRLSRINLFVATNDANNSLARERFVRTTRESSLGKFNESPANKRTANRIHGSPANPLRTSESAANIRTANRASESGANCESCANCESASTDELSYEYTDWVLRKGCKLNTCFQKINQSLNCKLMNVLFYFYSWFVRDYYFL